MRFSGRNNIPDVVQASLLCAFHHPQTEPHAPTLISSRSPLSPVPGPLAATDPLAVRGFAGSEHFMEKEPHNRRPSVSGCFPSADRFQGRPWGGTCQGSVPLYGRVISHHADVGLIWFRCSGPDGLGGNEFLYG